MADSSGSEQWWSVLGSSREWSLQLILPLGTCSCTLRGPSPFSLCPGLFLFSELGSVPVNWQPSHSEEEWKIGFSFLTAKELLAMSDSFFFFKENTRFFIKQLHPTCDLGFP